MIALVRSVIEYLACWFLEKGVGVRVGFNGFYCCFFYFFSNLKLLNGVLYAKANKMCK